MNEHKCSCNCGNEKELFNSSTMFFAVLCSCKAESHSVEHSNIHEVRTNPLSYAFDVEVETTDAPIN